MSWGHVVAIESYPQTLDAWGEVMLHYGYPVMYRFVCPTVNGHELVWMVTVLESVSDRIPSSIRGSVDILCNFGSYS
jgi:hypothetical protein